jgi:hypothetical protein
MLGGGNCLPGRQGKRSRSCAWSNKRSWVKRWEHNGSLWENRKGKNHLLTSSTHQCRNSITSPNSSQVLICWWRLESLDSAEIVKWVTKSIRPFSIVEDEGFNVLMKTGRPNYYIPSRHTVARDVKHVFLSTRRKIAKMLQASLLDTKTVKITFPLIIFPTSLELAHHGFTAKDNKWC